MVPAKAKARQRSTIKSPSRVHLADGGTDRPGLWVRPFTAPE